MSGGGFLPDISSIPRNGDSSVFTFSDSSAGWFTKKAQVLSFPNLHRILISGGWVVSGIGGNESHIYKLTHLTFYMVHIRSYIGATACPTNITIIIIIFNKLYARAVSPLTMLQSTQPHDTCGRGYRRWRDLALENRAGHFSSRQKRRKHCRKELMTIL